jgi:hypothetical protein
MGRRVTSPRPAAEAAAPPNPAGAAPAGSDLIARVKETYTGRQDISGSPAPSFTCILLNQLDAALYRGPDPDPEIVTLKEHAALRALQGIAPRDPVEGMLAAQMVATHEAAMECFRRAHLVGQNPELRLAALAQANRLVRSYAALAETLERRRRPPEQVVRVERVTVADGGRAIVGAVSHRGGGGMEEKARNNPMHLAITLMNRAPRCGARTRSGSPCRSPAVKGKKRCRMHGARAGAPEGNTNALKHGAWSAEARAWRRRVRELLREARALAGKV